MTNNAKLKVGGGRREVTRLSVGFILANSFTLTAFANFVDALRLASDDGDRSRQILCRWTVMSAAGTTLRASCGISVNPDQRLSDPRQFHYVVVVGGLLDDRNQIDADTGDWLRRAASAGVALIGVCTGSFILKRLGLLDGRRVCVSWYHRQDFINEFGAEPITDRLYVNDGDRITCSGGSSVLDLAAALVERHVGAAAARKALNVLQIDRGRAESAPQPTPRLALDAEDARVRRATLLMEQNLGHPLAIATIAKQIGVSTRQLDRLFRDELNQSPAECYRQMRLDYGQWLLKESNLAVVEVAAHTGFADGAHFARAFRTRFGKQPSALRAMAQAVRGSSQPANRRLFA